MIKRLLFIVTLALMAGLIACRQDAIGTPMCVTVDNDTLVDNTVTVRDRDTMQQVRVPIDNLRSMIFDELKPKK